MNIEELNGLRKELKKEYSIGIVATIGVIIVLFLIFGMRVISFLPFIIVAGILVVVIATSRKASEYNKAFKDYFVVSSLEKTFTDLKYEPDRGFPFQVIASTKMMYMGDRYSSNDYISAKYKDIAFEQADVHIEEEHTTTDSEGHTTTTYVTIFKGRWMIFDFNKTFKANVQITQKGFGNSRVKTLFGKKEELYKKVEMESAEFNKRFRVYAQNEHDAFYIITPSLMEKIQRLDDVNKGKLLFCFIDNKLHVGLYDGKDSFEHGSVFKEIDEEKVRNEISQDITKITQFVDELNLDNDLFRKEE